MSAFFRTATRAIARPTAVAAPVRAFSSTAQRSIARITVVGRLADTPQLRASSTGKEYLTYSVGSNTGSGDNVKTSWFRVRAFIDEGAQRDYYLNIPKGSLVMVEGNASYSAYEDPTDAEKKRYDLNIVQRNLNLLSRNRNAEQQE
ncbi:single-stranded DNA-binding protein rim1, mitochondrial [Podospora australis]|uniref:Single-stranded DNA-binding protein rim1, mitochondrial n=1 Tax=Podospora australis TaxID=1536484 RepID=A0AAN6WPI9_9PEZI|nr:single-stranded DNA-binding protein rim1, mitochondrial [Podospora australis]